MNKYFVLSLFLFLNIQCAFFVKEKVSLDPKEKLIAEINALVEDPVLDNAYIGIYIESLTDSSVLYDLNKYDLFIPASNEKLYTSAVALEKLTPDFRYTTDFFVTGDVSDSVLSGNLVIRGSGDPSISGRFYDDDVLKLFNDWADSLTKKGITKINGNLIGDESYFSDYKLGEGWNWDDEPFYYSAQISALSFNENVVDLDVWAADSIGDSVAVKMIPPTDYISLTNNAKVIHPDSSSDIDVWRLRGQNVAELNGGLKKDSRDTISVTVEDPANWFINVFAEVLKSKGIELDGELKTAVKYDSLVYQQSKLLFRHHSPPLRDIIAVVNKKSNNFYAEQVFKTIGAEIKGDGSAEAGSDVIKEWLEEIGITGKYAYPVDGSGLSRMNLVSPLATAAVLRKMYFSKFYNDFYQSLPIAGVDGTLKRRMKDSPAVGIVRAKTGFVRHARNLSGYTTDRDGNVYLFVILVNNYRVKTSYINNFQDKIAILLTSFSPQ